MYQGRLNALSKQRAIQDYQSAEAITEEGLGFARKGQLKKAITAFTTAKDPQYRDCQKTISYARKALKIGKTGSWMDTLAAVYAECGEFEKAVSTEKEAYRLSRPPNENFRRRIEVYKNGKTYADWRSQHPGRNKK